jgi:uncharacterized protein
VSVGHRLQDPLAELAKVEPRTIGVGPYQHDVNQAHLSRARRRGRDCVAEVGVDLNLASPRCWARAGPHHRLADNVVAVRSTVGPFRTREEMQAHVPGVTERRSSRRRVPGGVYGGDQPLDAAPHPPESYLLAQRIADAAGRPVAEVPGARTPFGKG